MSQFFVAYRYLSWYSWCPLGPFWWRVEPTEHSHHGLQIFHISNGECHFVNKIYIGLYMRTYLPFRGQKIRCVGRVLQGAFLVYVEISCDVILLTGTYLLSWILLHFQCPDLGSFHNLTLGTGLCSNILKDLYIGEFTGKEG